MPDQQYYENLYKPKNAGATSKNTTVSSSPATIPTYTPPTPSPTPEEIQHQKDQEDIQALLDAVKSSRTLFDDDYNDLLNACNNVDTSSRFLIVGAGRLSDWLHSSGDNRIGKYLDEYDSKIREIQNRID